MIAVAFVMCVFTAAFLGAAAADQAWHAATRVIVRAGLQRRKRAARRQRLASDRFAVVVCAARQGISS